MTDLRQAAQQALDAWDSPMGMKELCVAMDTFRAALEQQAEPLTCAWSPEDDDLMPGTYASACGELWSFIDGGWKDNRVRYCHGCGGRVIEAAHGIKAP